MNKLQFYVKMGQSNRRNQGGIRMAKKMNIIEVCPRDGWQNHKVMLSTETKLKYIKKMID